MAKPSRLLGARDGGPHVPAVAASAAVAAGTALAGKAIHDRVTEHQRRERARRYRLELDESPAAGVARIARAQLDLAIAALTARGGNGGEAIHEARKAIKRLRALVGLGRECLGEERYRDENRVLRDAGRELSAVRDAKVLIDTLDELRERCGDQLAGEPWAGFREALVSQAGLADQAPPARAAAVTALSDTSTRVATWPLPAEGGPQRLIPGLERIYRRGRRALRAAEHDPTPGNLHELRKRAKDLWHAAQLLGPVRPKRLKKLARRAHRLSDLLGENHDLSVLLDRAGSQRQLFDAGELELLIDLIERRRERLRRRGLRRALRLYRRKPRKLLGVNAGSAGG